MKKILTLFYLSLLALSAAEPFTSSKICKNCHPIIYKEYSESMHKNSSIFNDPVHAAVWNKHPLRKKGRYSCAPCHSPSDTRLTEALTKGKKALPKKDEIQTDEPIGCSYCHRIESIKHGKKRNINIISKKAKLYYAAHNGKSEKRVVKFHEESTLGGLGKKSAGSPFHTIDYSNENFSNGKICIGCHEFKKNSKAFSVCSMDLERSKRGKKNCITCHMPQVSGPISTLSDEKSHAFHGFAGLHVRPDLMQKHINLKAETKNGKLVVTLENLADHTLFAHPLRLAQLRVTIKRGNEDIELKPVNFYTILGKDGKPAMPWEAESVLKQNRIEAHEKVEMEFDFKPKSEDIVEAVLGFYIVNPKAGEKLGLKDSEVTKFKKLLNLKIKI